MNVGPVVEIVRELLIENYDLTELGRERRTLRAVDSQLGHMPKSVPADVSLVL
jgi:hypothetical protein